MSVILLMCNGLAAGIGGPRPGPKIAGIGAASCSIPIFAILYFVHRFRTTVPYRTSHSDPGVHNGQELRGKAVSQVSEPQQGGSAQPVSPEIV
jgi:hypothetical protein